MKDFQIWTSKAGGKEAIQETPAVFRPNSICKPVIYSLKRTGISLSISVP